MAQTETRILLYPEQTGINKIPLIGKSISKSAYDGLERHHHGGCIEIVYLDKGEQVYRINGDEEYILSGGDLFFTLPFEWHDTAELPQSRSVLFWLQLELIGNNANSVNIMNLPQDYSAALEREIMTLQNRKFKAGKNIKQYFEMLFNIPTDKSAMSKCMFESTVLNILLELVKLGNKASRKEFSDDISETLKFIEDNLSSELSVGRLASKVHLSVPRFKQKFKAEVGSPPIDYIQSRRIERAKELLAESQESITSIAFELGYSTSQYFSEVFKKYTGMSPREYKKSLL